MKQENIFGLHSVQALLKSAPQRVLEVFMVQGRNDQRLTKILHLAQSNAISCKIVDRKKDMILVSGFNVYPNEIEDVIAHMPGVLEVAAVGVPDEKSGEVVKIFVVKKDDGLTKESVLAYAKANLTGYKVPKHIEFRKELPKTNVGKILRRELKNQPTQSTTV